MPNPASSPSPKAWHPQPNTKGQRVPIHQPHQPSDMACWARHDSVAVATPHSALPAELHGIPFAPWGDAPPTEAAWEAVEGQADLDEPPFETLGHLDAAAGVVIREADGRVWICAPTNAFGGAYVIPKGRADGMTLQATAIKEAFEESGLRVAITGFIGDFNRTRTRTRYYLARRVGGSPANMGWESQAVLLVPPARLGEYLTGTANEKVLAALRAR
ncbi:NUDIX domain-containing protein [Ideonella sp. DXS29W]|uniref:NUDIX domain-containing protein n=1 Tax=Ideonella lacteola TaxID=2984193 RepID=A0ABU9BJQ9_9BURK